MSMIKGSNWIYETLLATLPKPLKALAIRFDNRPLGTVDQLTEFVRTRASYIAQTSLYGYLKTRMGTRFQDYFTDDTFSHAIRVSAIKVYVSCQADLTIHACARIAADSGLSPPQTAELARHCFHEGLRLALSPDDHMHVPAGAEWSFHERTGATLWANAAIGEAAFAGSAKDIVRYAPVIDEFKALDGKIVTNSIRFRWLDVRRQLEKRLDGPAIAADWRSLGEAGDRTEPQ